MRVLLVAARKKGLPMIHCILRSAAAALLLNASLGLCQSSSTGITPDPTPDPTRDSESKHLLWVMPNYRTSPSLTDYKPLTVRKKFKIAAEDSWDRGTVVLAAIVGAENQLTNSNRAFGQGAAGFGRYFGASYGDFVVGNYMTEAVFPSLLHQDPRYFRRGTGGVWSRLCYAIGQSFVTHNDSGGSQFNYSEWLGNSAAVAISNAYYANNRSARDSVSQLGIQVGIDTAGNILKEFYPEIVRKFTRKHQETGSIH
jgi:hypothetical protein